MSERIVAEALSRFGSIRAVVSLTDATIEVERWGSRNHKERRKGVASLAPAEARRLRELALEVRPEEQKLVVGDFYRDGEERLRIELEDHVVEIHNDSDRIRTPKARPLLLDIWELADRLVPRPK